MEFMSNRLRNRFDKLRASTAGVLLGVLALNACAGEEPGIEHNPDVTTITIETDAKVRENAAVIDDEYDGVTNLVFKNLGEDFSFDTPQGVDEKKDDNGVWFGVPAEDFPPDYQGMVNKDEDGVLWVNEQRASVTEEPTR